MQEKNAQETNLLQEMVTAGTINEDTIRRMLEKMEKEKQVARMHPYAITQLPDGRYKTWLPLPDGGRKDVRAKDKSVLLDKIIKFYETGDTQDTHLDNITLDRLFDQWLEYKRTVTESENTITRHRQHYMRYIAPLEISRRDVRDIDYLTMQAVCNGIVKDHALTRKEWTNTKTILKGMFSYAVEKGMITSSPIERVKITVKYRQVNRKKGAVQTYTTTEERALRDCLRARAETTGRDVFTAIDVNFDLGLRVGELVALKWQDIDATEKTLHVTREEVRIHAHGKISVAPHTKTHCDRYVHMAPSVIRALRDLYDRKGKPPREEYVFEEKGKRLLSRQVARALEQTARRAGVTYRPTHAIRRTYASKLQAGGLPVDEIRIQLGHKDLQTTMRYLYSPLTDEETAHKIDRIFEKEHILR